MPHADLTILVGSESSGVKPLEPYDAEVCNFLAKLSGVLRHDPEARSLSDIQTFAFWCRSANLTKMKQAYEDGRKRLGRGMVFHIAPSNIPINFAFSYVFGLLAGNANVVRVPTHDFIQVRLIKRALEGLLASGAYPNVTRMTQLVRYGHNAEITQLFSSQCQARIIWGGDATIREIRKFEMPTRSVEITFPDRYSFCVMAAGAILDLSDNDLGGLVEKFYNDTYLIDQNACSSPHLVVWLGSPHIKGAAKTRFWLALQAHVKQHYHLAAVQAIDKYTMLLEASIERDDLTVLDQYGAQIYTLGLAQIPPSLEQLRGKFGLFYQYEAEDLAGLTSAITPKFQTITYFGVDPVGLQSWVIEQRLSGIDRIVPVGSALDIGVIWDGYDIVKTLSRIVDYC